MLRVYFRILGLTYCQKPLKHQQKANAGQTEYSDNKGIHPVDSNGNANKVPKPVEHKQDHKAPNGIRRKTKQAANGFFDDFKADEE